ncbi:nucleoside recognition domain-containing protein [Clostridium estertheticum]|nr:nucleoside recognition domain-containing protein [Clostridium estertheticum]
MYLIGLIVAILVAGIINAIDKNNSINDLLIELPEYKAPSIQTVLLYVWDKVKGYLSKAGTIIFLSSLIIWFLFNFGSNGYTTEMENSFAAMLGKILIPFFAPLGLGFWQIIVALIAGISAKEVVVSSCSVLFSIPNINSPARMGTLNGVGFGPTNAFAFMVFSLLYIPCIGVLAAIRKEFESTRWMLFTALFQLL